MNTCERCGCDRLDAIREDLREEEDKVRQDAARVRQEATQLAQERRRWHDDLDLLSAREENLRAYEERLRRLQAQVEAGQLSWHAQQPSAAPAASAVIGMTLNNPPSARTSRVPVS
jgi:predicted  nucleic acid-binding Zn-ribbon protein